MQPKQLVEFRCENCAASFIFACLSETALQLTVQAPKKGFNRANRQTTRGRTRRRFVWPRLAFLSFGAAKGPKCAACNRYRPRECFSKALPSLGCQALLLSHSECVWPTRLDATESWKAQLTKHRRTPHFHRWHRIPKGS